MTDDNEPKDFCTYCGLDYDAMGPAERALHGCDGEYIVRTCLEVRIKATFQHAYPDARIQVEYHGDDEEWVVTAGTHVFHAHVGSDDDELAFKRDGITVIVNLPDVS